MSHPIYAHRQFGTVIVVSCAATLVALLVAGFQSGWPHMLLAVGLVLAAVLAMGYCLDVRVDDTAIHVAMGIGWIRKTIPLADVRSAEPSTHGGFFGWGIRWIPGGGWMWAVSGLRSVALELEGGRKFRIGTDDPGGLSSAIRNALSAASPSK